MKSQDPGSATSGKESRYGVMIRLFYTTRNVKRNMLDAVSNTQILVGITLVELP